MPPSRTDCHKSQNKRVRKDEECHQQKKKKTKDERMNGRKESGRQGGGKGRNRGGCLDPEAIWLSCSVRLLAKKCFALNST